MDPIQTNGAQAPQTTPPVTPPAGDDFDKEFNAFLEEENAGNGTQTLPITPPVATPPVKPEEKKDLDLSKFATKDEVAQARRETAVTNWLSQNPEFSEFSDQIKKVAADPRAGTFSNIESLVGAAIGIKNVMKVAAKVKQEVVNDNKDNKPVNTNARPIEQDETGAVKDVEKLTDDEWKKVKQQYGVA